MTRIRTTTRSNRRDTIHLARTSSTRGSNASFSSRTLSSSRTSYVSFWFALLLTLSFLLSPVSDAYAAASDVVSDETQTDAVVENDPVEESVVSVAAAEPAVEEVDSPTDEVSADESPVVDDVVGETSQSPENEDPQSEEVLINTVGDVTTSESVTLEPLGTEVPEQETLVADSASTTPEVTVSTDESVPTMGSTTDTDRTASTENTDAEDSSLNDAILNESPSAPEVLGTSTTETNVNEPTVVPDTVASNEVIVPTPPLPEEVVATTSDIVLTDDTASTTDDAASSTEPLPFVINNIVSDNRITFGTNECVPVGGGAFHCVERDKATEAVGGENSPVFSAPDKDGDLEIYIKENGTFRALTNNLVDDDAPALDSRDGYIVWQSLIDDRYQIMRYDPKTEAVTQLTHGSVNSMEPAVYEGEVVYQAWRGNDWDIVLSDGDHEEVLTDNDTHDIAPSITEDYIMWQSDEEGEWVAKVYDRKTKDIETVHGVKGGNVENPRMVMVFDSRAENGDVKTMGYDLKRGELVPLAAVPTPLPREIPVPEHQEEEKALIQAPTTTRIETKATTTPDVSGAGGDPDPEPAPRDTVVEDGASTTPAVSDSVTDVDMRPTTTQQDESADLTIAGVTEGATDTFEAELTLDLSTPTDEVEPPVPDLVIESVPVSEYVSTTTSETGE